MAITNQFTFDVDVKQKNFIEEPVVTQNDDVTFVLNINDNGQPFDISTIQTHTILTMRPDQQAVQSLGVKTGANQVTYTLGTTDIALPGRVKAAIQMYDASGRISSIPFSYVILPDLEEGYIPSENEKTLIELVLGEGPVILADAQQATINANEATFNASIAVEGVNAAILATEQATDAATVATNEAALATGAAEIATTATKTATSEAITATDGAIQATSEAVTATNAISLVLPNIEGLEYVEPYNSATQYSKNNIVRYNKNAYIALQTTIGNEPTGLVDSVYWGVLAVGGVDGSGSVVTVNGVSPGPDGNVELIIPDPDLTSYAKTSEVQTVADALTTHLADYLKHTGYAIATGTANAYTATLDPALSAYQEGVSLRLKINVANTGASTVNVNGLGAKAIKKSNGNAVASGNLKAGSVYTLAYDGASFILQGEGGEYGNALPSQVLAPNTLGTEDGIKVGTMVNRGSFNLGLDEQVLSGYYSGGRTPKGMKIAEGLSASISQYQTLRITCPFQPKFVHVWKPEWNGYVAEAVSVVSEVGLTMTSGGFGVSIDTIGVNYFEVTLKLGLSGTNLNWRILG